METIFISYSWTDSQIVDEIDKAFAPTGFSIKRDVREIEFKGSIKEYMKQVRETDFVLMIISDNFLKSSNAMFEVLEVLKDSNFKNKIIPILVDDTNVFKPEDRLIYVKYWSEKYEELKKQLEKVQVTDSLKIYEDLRHLESIKRNIDEFLNYLSDSNISKFSELALNNFKKIFDYLGIENNNLISEILGIEEIPTDEEKEIEIDRLESKYPLNPKIYFLKGHYAYERNQIRKSNYYYRKSIELDASFSASYFNLACNLEFFDENFDEASLLYEKAITLDPIQTKSYINLAGIYSSKLNKPLKSIELLSKAIYINPYDSTSYFNIALVYHRDLKEFSKALENYEKAIKLKKDFIDAKYNYGKILNEEFNKSFEAKEQFIEILKINSKHKNTLFELAKLLEFKYNHFETAKIYYDQYMQNSNLSAEDHHWYAMFLILRFKSSFKKLAKEHYNIAITRDPNLLYEEETVLFN